MSLQPRRKRQPHDPALVLRLKKPCPDCPFNKEDAIELRPGRLEGIIESLVEDDVSTFHCHLTVHSKVGGTWDDEGVYTPSGNEALCAGAAAYLQKIGRPTLGMRFGIALGIVEPDHWESAKELVIEPLQG